MLELYCATKAIQKFKIYYSNFPDYKLPTLFYSYLIWINPSEDDLLEKGLCQLSGMNRVDFTHSLFDMLREQKILAK